MRRIAMAAAVAATLAGGTAAVAATPGPAGTDAPPPDPYQGAWQLQVDGVNAGPVLNVDGCDLKGQVLTSLPGTARHVAAVAPEPCTFDAGGGMSPAFYSWLDNALKGNGTTHSAQLVRADARPGYGLALSHATVAGVMLPRVDRAATAPVYLRVSLAAEQVRRVPATVAPSPSRTAPILASSLTVSVAGQRTGVTSVGPWTATIKQPADVGRAGEVGLRPRPADVGDLPLRLPELGKVGFDLDGWAQSVLAKGMTDQEQPVTVALSGLTLTLGNAAPDRADLAARADGARTYDLYAETAGMTATK